MTAIVKLWKKESALIVSVVLALAAAGLIPGTAGKVIGIVLPLLAGQAVRATVYAPTTVAAKVEMAATSVAGQLAPDTVGPAGTVLPAAQDIIGGVVSGVLGD